MQALCWLPQGIQTWSVHVEPCFHSNYLLTRADVRTTEKHLFLWRCKVGYMVSLTAKKNQAGWATVLIYTVTVHKMAAYCGRRLVDDCIGNICYRCSFEVLYSSSDLEIARKETLAGRAVTSNSSWQRQSKHQRVCHYYPTMELKRNTQLSSLGITCMKLSKLCGSFCLHHQCWDSWSRWGSQALCVI